jgi:hypothetical protein
MDQKPAKSSAHPQNILQEKDGIIYKLQVRNICFLHSQLQAFHKLFLHLSINCPSKSVLHYLWTASNNFTVLF